MNIKKVIKEATEWRCFGIIKLYNETLDGTLAATTFRIKGDKPRLFGGFC